MSSTPEGRIKRKVSALLREFPRVWYDMPVPGGYGKSTLDYVGCANGYFFAIETKAPGKKPTERQEAMINSMESAGAKTFVIDGDAGLNELEDWLHEVRAAQPYREPHDD